jgi:arylformamidase
MTIFDITTPLRTDLPVWPGHARPEIYTTRSHEEGHGVQVTHLSIGAHTGTHLDAPRHFVAGAGLVTDLDLNVLMGECVVLHYTGTGAIPASFFQAANLPTPCPRILLKCNHNAGKLDTTETEFFEDYAGITPEAATWLVENGLQLIGTDYLSIGPYRALVGDPNREVHLTLLGAKVIIVEGLDLRAITPGAYTLVCLPILLAADGAPCRAVLLPAGTLL